jgi:flagellum-specific ATP synthase
MNPEAQKTYLAHCRNAIEHMQPYAVSGRLTRINGLVMEAAGLKLALGADCRITTPGGSTVDAEVVGFNGDKLFMMPSEDVYGLAPGAQVTPVDAQPNVPAINQAPVPNRRVQDKTKHLPVGDTLLGRVVDANGRPLDDLGPLGGVHARPLMSRPFNPLSRAPRSATN